MKTKFNQIKISKSNVDIMRNLFLKSTNLKNYIGGSNGLLQFAAIVAIANKKSPEDSNNKLKSQSSVTRTFEIDREAINYVRDTEFTDEEINKLIDVGLEIIFEKINKENSHSDDTEENFMEELSKGSFFPE